MTLLQQNKKMLLDKDIQEYKDYVKDYYGIDITITLSTFTNISKEVSLMSLQNLKDVIEEVFCDKNESEIKNRTRKPNIVFLRHLFCKVAMDLGFSSTRIGDFLNRDHSTVLHARNEYNKQSTIYPNYVAAYNNIINIIQNDSRFIQYSNKEQINP